jgi:MoaA/NifB/PqqE/SkfB family radical SAM enzyme
MNNIVERNFPESISFTITNACNLRCKMCGQWSETGYMLDEKSKVKPAMKLSDWKRVIDELVEHNIGSVLIRGGEPFLYPHIQELLNYLDSKKFYISIDTNGTMLREYAADLVRIGNIHCTFSVDGPEEIHDEVRGVKGCYQEMKENIMYLHELEKNNTKKIGKSICFTISPYSYKGLGVMPDVARSLGIDTLTIVPYSYISNEMGKEYEKILSENFGCRVFSCSGFHHETSGVDLDIFIEQFGEFESRLNGIRQFPYMGLTKSYLTENDYKKWFGNSTETVCMDYCNSVEKLIDIQPDGGANYCVDVPDYHLGNVLTSSVFDAWNSKEAKKFREYRRENKLPVCHRCVSKFMAEISNKI